jgi:hypothetical protein
MTPQIPEHVKKSLNLARTPALWPETAIDQLVDNLVTLSLYLGVHYTEELFEEIRPFYWYVADKTTSEQRLKVLTQMAELVERFEAGLASLLLFLRADEEPAVTSTAALSLCVLIPLRNSDPLTGPKYVLDFLEMSNSDKSRAGILQGILLLGDRRILPLLYRCWEKLGSEGRRLLAHSWSGFVYASTIEFLLEWLEKTDEESDYSSIVASLASFPLRQTNAPFVLDVERKFPANGHGEGPPVRFLYKWTFEEYGKIIAPRLKAITESEKGDKIMPHVLAAWGIRLEMLKGPPESWQRTLLSYSFYLGLGAVLLDRPLAFEHCQGAPLSSDTAHLVFSGFTAIEETTYTDPGSLWSHAVNYLYNFMSLTSPETIGPSADMKLVKERAPIAGFTPALRLGLENTKFGQALFADAIEEERNCDNEELVARLKWMKDFTDEVTVRVQKTLK